MLLTAQEVKGQRVGLLGHVPRVVLLGDADQVPGRLDAALGHEPHQAAAALLGRRNGHHEEGIVQQVDEGGDGVGGGHGSAHG